MDFFTLVRVVEWGWCGVKAGEKLKSRTYATPHLYKIIARSSIEPLTNISAARSFLFVSSCSRGGYADEAILRESGYWSTIAVP